MTQYVVTATGERVERSLFATNPGDYVIFVRSHETGRCRWIAASALAEVQR